jgi:transcriptional regulator with PAS, ATPase and Fis domain
VGETQSRIAEGRVITATNKNLEVAVAEGEFREDLYFRLSADRLETVPLSALIAGKVDALHPMVKYITRNLLHESWTPDVVEDSLQFIGERLGADYPWPGNFRELEQCLRNFLIHRDYHPVRFGVDSKDTLIESLMDTQPSAEHLLHRYARALHVRTGSYKAVGDIMGVDQRTAKKYVG